MKQQLEQRLKELRAEHAAGQKALAELESKQTSLRSTLIRINGAIQVPGRRTIKGKHPRREKNKETR